jgi:hypothetical protein
MSVTVLPIMRSGVTHGRTVAGSSGFDGGCRGGAHGAVDCGDSGGSSWPATVDLPGLLRPQ